jgi:hypothetical protein
LGLWKGIIKLTFKIARIKLVMGGLEGRNESGFILIEVRGCGKIKK